MFDIFAKLLSSITSFLFPLYASYKALKTSDPAQLTPWLMYWVVLACALLVESWTDWILVWIPFYAYLRLLFLLYLILPQTQGARIIYQTYIHPFLEDNEVQIEEFIADAHERLKTAGIAYLKHAIELLKTNILGLPPGEPSPAPEPTAAGPQSYTQSLLARFSVPAARWTGSGNTGADFYNLLASAVSAASTAASGTGAQQNMSASGTLIPPNLTDARERISFIAAQREKLNFILTALNREATELERAEALKAQNNEQHPRATSLNLDGSEEETQRPASGFSVLSGLSKSRSEADFEKIDAESGAEDEGNLRRRAQPSTGGSWLPWGWGASAPPTPSEEKGSSSGIDH